MGNNIVTNLKNSANDIDSSFHMNPSSDEGGSYNWTPLIQSWLVYLLVITFLTLIITIPPLDIVVTVSAPKTVLTAADKHSFSNLISDSHQDNRFVLSYHNNTKNSTSILYGVKFDGQSEQDVGAFNIIQDSSLSPHSSYDGVMLATRQRAFHSTVYEADENGEVTEQFQLSNMDMVNNADTLVSNVVPNHMVHVGDRVFLSQIANNNLVNCDLGQSDADIQNKMLNIQLDQDNHQSLQITQITHMNDVLSYAFPTSNTKNSIIAFILYNQNVKKSEFVDGEWSTMHTVNLDNGVGDNSSMIAIDENSVVITSTQGITIVNFERNSTSNYPLNNNTNHTNTVIFEQNDGSNYVICVIDNRLCVFDEDMNLLQMQQGHISHIHQRRIGSYTHGNEHYVYFVDGANTNHVKCVLVRSVS